jgi:transposase
LLAARSGRSSERLSDEQLALFAAELNTQVADKVQPPTDDDRDDDPTAKPGETPKGKPRGRRPIPGHLKRERILHDLTESEKHCKECNEELRKIGEEVSERYEYIPAQMTVI